MMSASLYYDPILLLSDFACYIHPVAVYLLLPAISSTLRRLATAVASAAT